MLSPPAQSGHLVVKGYVKDIQNDDVALAQNTLSSKPFWKLCGSCAAFRYDTYDATFAKALGAILQHEHRMFPYLAKLAGRPLHAFARPMALYLLNHGDNFGARRGRVGFKTRFVQRFKLTDKNDLDAIATRKRLRFDHASKSALGAPHIHGAAFAKPQSFRPSGFAIPCTK